MLTDTGTEKENMSHFLHHPQSTRFSSAHVSQSSMIFMSMYSSPKLPVNNYNGKLQSPHG